MATLQFSEGTNAPTAIHQRKQLLPNLVDGMARTRPGAIYAETPLSPTTYDKGYLKITYRALANASMVLPGCYATTLVKGPNMIL